MNDRPPSPSLFASGETSPQSTVVETAFRKLTGRRASAEERERLYRLRDALQLQDNDTFWSIVMALEHYDAFFRQYPERLAEVTEIAIERARTTFAAAAARESALAQKTLAEQVARTSVEIARKLAERPVGIHRFTFALAFVVAFGALCVDAGYALTVRADPFWVHAAAARGAWHQRLATVLSLPAGWMIFALLIPSMAYGAIRGWGLASDNVAPAARRALGWCVITACGVACAACAALVAEVT